MSVHKDLHSEGRSNISRIPILANAKDSSNFGMPSFYQGFSQNGQIKNLKKSFSTPSTTKSLQSSSSIFPNYNEEKEKCVEFLRHYSTALDPSSSRKYEIMLQEVANRERIVFPIELDDILAFNNDGPFIRNITKNGKRYTELFADVIDSILPPPTKRFKRDVLDVLNDQRMAEENKENEINGLNNISGIQNKNSLTEEKNKNPLEQNADFSKSIQNNQRGGLSIPKILLRRFEVQLIPGIKLKQVSIRQIKSDNVGSLVRVTGMVTRVSTVKPMMQVATFSCDKCCSNIYQETLNSRQFNPVSDCPSKKCQINKTNGRLLLQTKACKFQKFQEMKVQELPDQVPMGHIPRSMTFFLRGELTRTCDPGEIVTLSGIFLPQPFTAQNQLRAGLITDTYIEVTQASKDKKKYDDIELSDDYERQIQELRSTPNANFYTMAAQSIAPEIYGHDDVKKALLLLMTSGVTKEMIDGMKIRGTINILLMGDPGVAKSQLLKHISSIAPRAVYTTGKGSSGVGLTAAVIRDNITKEMILEGGALVLADNGICCIDEFDKMEDADRTAIHEVMEQMTVSIAKAGITTTLNARTSVLAAANPIYGRYNRKLSPAQNINLSNALLSRFDLLFLLLDTANYTKDEALARHITYVHRYSRNPVPEGSGGNTIITPQILRYIIACAKCFNPVIPRELSSYIVEAYVTLRQEDLTEHNKTYKNNTSARYASGSSANHQTAMTARQLLSILRLSQALARLQFHDKVQQEDVDEAIRLVYVSKSSLMDHSMDSNNSNQNQSSDICSKIYRCILDYAKEKNIYILNYSELEPIILRKGYTLYQLNNAIKLYESLDIWQKNTNGTTLTLLS